MHDTCRYTDERTSRCLMDDGSKVPRYLLAASIQHVNDGPGQSSIPPSLVRVHILTGPYCLAERRGRGAAAHTGGAGLYIYKRTTATRQADIFIYLAIRCVHVYRMYLLPSCLCIGRPPRVGAWVGLYACVDSSEGGWTVETCSWLFAIYLTRRTNTRTGGWNASRQAGHCNFELACKRPAYAHPVTVLTRSPLFVPSERSSLSHFCACN
mmetsp:Transcript_23384/g.67117  ORF Transcript_23384/g.67117 Transcript_23384/m.67117 type:complete len:210 (+) Transcript_23384:289-918(+)